MICSEGIVLRSYPLGDNDKIAVVFTQAVGKISGVARDARRMRSRFSGSLEPLNWIEILYFLKEGRDLASINKIDLIHSYSSKVPTYLCFLQLSWLAELVLETTPEKEPNDSLFRLMLLVLPRLNKPTTSDLAQLYFEVWYLTLSGLFPSCKSCQLCGRNLGSGQEAFLGDDFTRFSCSNCKQRSDFCLSGETFRLIRLILAKSLKDLEIDLPQPGLLRGLSYVIEAMVEKSFERKFPCLKLIQSER